MGKPLSVPLPLSDSTDDVPTYPDTPVHNDLVDAVEWLRRAGIVSDSKPPFAVFYEEVVNSAEGDAEP